MGLFSKFRETVSRQQQPVPEIPEVRADIRRSYAPEPLTRADRGDLLRLRDDSSYQVLLKLMERECEALVTALIKTEPWNAEKVLANQVAANVAWNFYEHLQAAVKIECEIEVAEREGSKILNNDLDSAAVINRILDPLYTE